MKRILLAVLVLFGLQTQAQLVSPCDSIDIVGSQSQLSMEVMSGVNMYSPLYMVTTTSSGYVLGEDSLSWTHYAYPGIAIGTDTITTCISYTYGVDTLICCTMFYWNPTTSLWGPLSGQPTQCDASFTVSQEMFFDSLNPNSGVVPVPNSLIVTNTSTGNGLTYSWDLGDGSTATGFTVSHTYATSGPFNLCLTVSDSTGCSDVFCDSIGVNSAGLSIGKQAGFSINMTGIMGISNLEVDYMFNLYPNPTVDHVNVEVGALSEVAQLSVLDLTGRVVYSDVVKPSALSQLITVDLTTIPTGVYQVSLDTRDGVLNKRLIVK